MLDFVHMFHNCYFENLLFKVLYNYIFYFSVLKSMDQQYNSS